MCVCVVFLSQLFLCVCVCVCVREREREREIMRCNLRAPMYVCVHMYFDSIVCMFSNNNCVYLRTK